MSEDQAPPPHGAESPKPESDTVAHLAEGPGIGALGVTLIGGAVAAAVGLLVAIPLLRRTKHKPAPAKPKPTPQARRPRRKRTEA
jgi:hypothetical protein